MLGLALVNGQRLSEGIKALEKVSPSLPPALDDNESSTICAWSHELGHRLLATQDLTCHGQRKKWNWWEEHDANCIQR